MQFQPKNDQIENSSQKARSPMGRSKKKDLSHFSVPNSSKQQSPAKFTARNIDQSMIKTSITHSLRHSSVDQQQTKGTLQMRIQNGRFGSSAERLKYQQNSFNNQKQAQLSKEGFQIEFGEYINKHSTIRQSHPMSPQQMQSLNYSDGYVEDRPFGSATREIKVVEGSQDKPQLTQRPGQESVGFRMDEVLLQFQQGHPAQDKQWKQLGSMAIPFPALDESKELQKSPKSRTHITTQQRAMKFVQPRRSIPEDQITIAAFNNDVFTHVVNAKLPSNPEVSTAATRLFNKGKREDKSRSKPRIKNPTSPRINDSISTPEHLMTQNSKGSKVTNRDLQKIQEKDASGFSEEITKQLVPSQTDCIEPESSTFHVEGNVTDQMINVTMNYSKEDGLTPIQQPTTVVHVAPHKSQIPSPEGERRSQPSFKQVIEKSHSDSFIFEEKNGTQDQSLEVGNSTAYGDKSNSQKLTQSISTKNGGNTQRNMISIHDSNLKQKYLNEMQHGDPLNQVDDIFVDQNILSAIIQQKKIITSTKCADGIVKQAIQRGFNSVRSSRDSTNAMQDQILTSSILNNYSNLNPGIPKNPNMVVYRPAEHALPHSQQVKTRKALQQQKMMDIKVQQQPHLNPNFKKQILAASPLSPMSNQTVVMEQTKIDLPQQPVVLSGENVIEYVPTMTSPAITSWQNDNVIVSEERNFPKLSPPGIEVKFDYNGQSDMRMQPSKIVISSRNQVLHENLTAPVPGEESQPNHGVRNLPSKQTQENIGLQLIGQQKAQVPKNVERTQLQKRPLRNILSSSRETSMKIGMTSQKSQTTIDLNLHSINPKEGLTFTIRAKEAGRKDNSRNRSKNSKSNLNNSIHYQNSSESRFHIRNNPQMKDLRLNLKAMDSPKPGDEQAPNEESNADMKVQMQETEEAATTTGPNAQENPYKKSHSDIQSNLLSKDNPSDGAKHNGQNSYKQLTQYVHSEVTSPHYMEGNRGPNQANFATKYADVTGPETRHLWTRPAMNVHTYENRSPSAAEPSKLGAFNLGDLAHVNQQLQQPQQIAGIDVKYNGGPEPNDGLESQNMSNRYSNSRGLTQRGSANRGTAYMKFRAKKLPKLNLQISHDHQQSSFNTQKQSGMQVGESFSKDGRRATAGGVGLPSILNSIHDLPFTPRGDYNPRRQIFSQGYSRQIPHSHRAGVFSQTSVEDKERDYELEQTMRQKLINQMRVEQAKQQLNDIKHQNGGVDLRVYPSVKDMYSLQDGFTSHRNYVKFEIKHEYDSIVGKPIDEEADSRACESPKQKKKRSYQEETKQPMSSKRYGLLDGSQQYEDFIRQSSQDMQNTSQRDSILIHDKDIQQPKQNAKYEKKKSPRLFEGPRSPKEHLKDQKKIKDGLQQYTGNTTKQIAENLTRQQFEKMAMKSLEAQYRYHNRLLSNEKEREIENRISLYRKNMSTQNTKKHLAKRKELLKRRSRLKHEKIVNQPQGSQNIPTQGSPVPHSIMETPGLAGSPCSVDLNSTDLQSAAIQRELNLMSVTSTQGKEQAAQVQVFTSFGSNRHDQKLQDKYGMLVKKQDINFLKVQAVKDMQFQKENYQKWRNHEKKQSRLFQNKQNKLLSNGMDMFNDQEFLGKIQENVQKKFEEQVYLDIQKDMNSFQNIQNLVKKDGATPKHERSVDHKAKNSNGSLENRDYSQGRSKLKSANKRSQEQLELLNETENLQYSNQLDDSLLHTGDQTPKEGSVLRQPAKKVEVIFSNEYSPEKQQRGEYQVQQSLGLSHKIKFDQALKVLGMTSRLPENPDENNNNKGNMSTIQTATFQGNNRSSAPQSPHSEYFSLGIGKRHLEEKIDSLIKIQNKKNHIKKAVQKVKSIEKQIETLQRKNDIDHKIQNNLNLCVNSQRCHTYSLRNNRVVKNEFPRQNDYSRQNSRIDEDNTQMKASLGMIQSNSKTVVQARQIQKNQYLIVMPNLPASTAHNIICQQQDVIDGVNGLNVGMQKTQRKPHLDRGCGVSSNLHDKLSPFSNSPESEMITNKIRIIEGTNININTEYMFSKNKYTSSLNAADTQKFQEISLKSPNDISQADARSYINVSSGDDKSRTMLNVLIPVGDNTPTPITAQEVTQTIVNK